MIVSVSHVLHHRRHSACHRVQLVLDRLIGSRFRVLEQGDHQKGDDRSCRVDLKLVARTGKLVEMARDDNHHDSLYQPCCHQ